MENFARYDHPQPIRGDLVEERTHQTSLRRYLLVALSPLLILVLVAAFNIVVDPKGLFQLLEFERFNSYKPFETNNFVEHKSLALRRYRPDTIIGGPSSVTFGVVPECHNSPMQLSRIYNYGGVGVSPGAILKDIDDIAAIGSVKRIVVEWRFEYGDFVPSAKSSERRATKSVGPGLLPRLLSPWIPARHLSSYFEGLFSWGDLLLSVRTILANQEKDKSSRFRRFNADGSFDQEWLRRFDAWVITEEAVIDHVAHYSNHFLGHWSNDFEVDFSSLLQLIEATSGYGIHVDLFIPPEHVTELLFYSEAGVWPLYEKFKVAFALAVEKANERYSADIHLFDFGNISDATTQTIKRADGHTWDPLFFDPVHFRRAVGDFILATTLGCNIDTPVPNDFGTELNTASIPQHLAIERGKLAAYRANHPDLVKKIRAAIGSQRKGSFDEQFPQ